MPKSKPFEGGSTPASAGRLSPDEYGQMAEHAKKCPACQSGEAEFTAALQNLPPDEREKLSCTLNRHFQEGGLRSRFVERAHAEGIHFSAAWESCQGEKGWNWSHACIRYAWAAAAVLVLIVSGFGYWSLRPRPRQVPVAKTQVAAEAKPSAQAPDTRALEARMRESEAALETSQATVSELRAENEALSGQVAGLEKEFAASQTQRQALQQSLSNLSDQNAQLSSQNDHNTQLLARAKADSEEIRARVAELEKENGIEKAEAGALAQQLKSQTATLGHQQDLLAAGRDITDLMGARSLHIIDVRDADARGNNRRSFGRIFYTEGKSLIFYAYDLDERKVAKANYSFDVWGEHLGEPTSIRNLGILYVDDKVQKRWALKVDDPRQLAEINSVFVTLEPHEAGDKPRGQRILFAFLGGKANHP